ncbi:hypothetical protein CANARDRAFT_29848 [[Candida] arabinofermentans NRRL YB-2248]|uniref:Large ribosomal subunit protein uL30-like ferredoxin-like fold domain-containing protein n=1 Tax=[Candida] arabinofermentans NRRL YB-2248 TaxID=983967 RepID=A0A1E4SVU2_9ASCO|nr:hypothetical protein CANARDRAFT_29848 [[Candida] arabinofermentans NRRL YB-2248]
MAEVTEKLNSNPEILLKKRKNADRLRLEKQEQAKKRSDEQKRRKLEKRKAKFIRAETLVAKHRSTEREQYRIKRISDNEKNKIIHDEVNESDEKLQFIVRIPGPHGAKVPSKAKKVLGLLRLEHVYDGTFIKANSAVKPLLRLINPYIVIGSPSLSTVRNLIQKRANVEITQQDGSKKIIPLNDNNLIEEALGHENILCTEDLIHEIITVGTNFKSCIKFLHPFKLNPPVHGWGPLSKLKRLELREGKPTINYASNAQLSEVDIDQFIQEQI